MSNYGGHELTMMGMTPLMVAHLREKRHGKFRYWTNRKYKDIENLRRIKRILEKEKREKSM